GGLAGRGRGGRRPRRRGRRCGRRLRPPRAGTGGPWANPGRPPPPRPRLAVVPLRGEPTGTSAVLPALLADEARQRPRRRSRQGPGPGPDCSWRLSGSGSGRYAREALRPRARSGWLWPPDLARPPCEPAPRRTWPHTRWTPRRHPDGTTRAPWPLR